MQQPQAGWVADYWTLKGMPACSQAKMGKPTKCLTVHPFVDVFHWEPAKPPFCSVLSIGSVRHVCDDEASKDTVG